MRYRRRRLFVISSLAVLGLVLGLMSIPAGPARAAAGPGSANTPCYAGGGVYCSVATIDYAGPTSTCGATDFFGSRDAFGTPIGWTYANGSTYCTEVYFTPANPFGTGNEDPPSGATCRVWFYVPDGDATATIDLVAYSYGGGDSDFTINESSANGWDYLGSYYNLNGHFDFSDANGQSYPTKIGWGEDPQLGIYMACP